MKKSNQWKLAWSNKGEKSFPPAMHENTYLIDLPEGWLLRHIFIAGKNFTQSSIVYFPDPERRWQLDNLEVKWEMISNRRTPNFVEFTSRLKTPEGWVVKELLTTKRVRSTEGTSCISLTYVDDKEHKWQI